MTEFYIVRPLRAKITAIMKMNVEIELRVPALSIKDENDVARRIDNSLVRFRRIVEVPEFPKPGSEIMLSFGDRVTFPCTVENAHWDEGKQLFVLPCQYPNRRILPEEYETLLNDAQWERTELQA